MFALMETLNDYIWITDFIVLCIFSAFAFKQSKNNSSLLTQAFVVIISGIIIKYRDLVNGFTDPLSSQAVLNLWLGGFAFYDAVIILALVAFYKSFVSKHQKALRMAYIGLTSLLMLNFIVAQYAPFLFDVEGVSYKLWVIMAFFFGIALLDGLAVYAIYKLHRFFNLTHCLIARMYMLAFAVAALFQIAGFCAKYFWHSKSFEPTYQVILASINICTSFVALLIAFLAAYQLMCKKNREGVLWRI